MDARSNSAFALSQKHLLGIEGLSAEDINGLLDLSDEFVAINRRVHN